MRIPLLSRGKGERATDPVCHMQVDKNNPPGGKAEHGGQTYYFCGPGCRRNFEKEPAKYLEAGGHGGSGHHM